MKSYTYTPAETEGKEIKMDSSWGPKVVCSTVKPQVISYGEARFNHFSAREVFINDEPTGEYHIKIPVGSGSHIRAALDFFTLKLAGCEMGIIDGSGSLNLEHQIYIKTTDPLRVETMMETLERLDGDL